MHSNLPEEIRFQKIIYFSFLTLICVIFFVGVIFFSSCQYLPQAFDDIEKIANNDAITIKCDKDCFQKKNDMTIQIAIKNSGVNE